MSQIAARETAYNNPQEGENIDELCAKAAMQVRDDIISALIFANQPTATLLEPLDPPGSARMTLVIVVMFAASVTLAWLYFMAWLVFKGVSLL